MALLNRSTSAAATGRAHAVRWALAFAALLSLAAPAALPAAPADRPVSRQEVRAVFILHLARFVRWPETVFARPDSPLVIGVYQSDELADILRDAVRGEKIDGRPIECRRLATPGEIDDCHLVFVGESAVRPLAPLLARLADRPILLVSDAEGFLNLGGHVQFYAQAAEMKIRLAPNKLKNAHLAASSQLLRVARVN
jgi:hypothetical protein